MGKSVQMQVTYNDWSGGDWGVLDGLTVARMNAPMFRGENMQVYRNGSLGPRPGFKQLQTSGTKPAASDTQLLLDVYNFQLVDCVLDSVFASKLFEFQINPAGVSLINTDLPPSAFGPNPPVNFTRGASGEAFVGPNRWGGSSFTGLVTVGTVGNLTPRTIRYRDRMYYYGNSATVYYSDPGNYIVVPAANNFTIQNSGNVVDAFIFRNTLYFIAARGAGGLYLNSALYSLTGASPNTGTLTEVAQSSPVGPWNSMVAGANDVVGLSSGDGTLWSFNGSTFEFMEHLRKDPERLPSSAGYINPLLVYADRHLRPVYVQGVDAFIVPWRTWQVGQSWRTYGLLERVNGVWCYSTIPGNNTHGIRGIANDERNVYIKWALSPGTATDTFYFARAVCLDRPAMIGESWGTDVETFPDNPTNNSERPWFYIPPVIAPEGADGVRIARIMLDVDYWQGAGGTYGAAEISCRIFPRGYYNEDQLDPNVVSYDGVLTQPISGWAPATVGVQPKKLQIWFTFPMAAPARSVDIMFHNIQNIAVHRVVVFLESTQRIYPGGW